MKRRRFLALTMAALVVIQSGCGGQSVKKETEKSADNEIKVGLILSTGGLGDKSFNDMAYEGIMRAQEELGIQFDYVEPASVSDFVSLQRQFAETEEYDLLIAIGNDQGEAVKEVAADFPEQKISLLDSTEDIEGVRSVQTWWREQTFLTGVLAGLGTKSDMEKANPENVIGVVLGMDLPNQREGAAGFAAGARYVNPDAEVIISTVGAFNDPSKGKEIALSMYNRDADFILHLAGASGLGVFAAAKEADRYVMGAGSNQNGEEPDYVAACAIRHLDGMVYGEIKAVIDNLWEPGLHMSGLKEGVVGYTTENSNVVFSEENLKIVEEIKNDVISGKLVPCDSLDKMDAWVAENQYGK